jgi:plasmid stabilization system protein ParE
MSRQSRSLKPLHLTDRSLQDIAAIEQYSVEQWGRKSASKYISDIDAALGRIQANPVLLKVEEGFHDRPRFYRVNRHLLVCDVGSHDIVVLTVVHASMDIPARLAELEPTLAAEIELLHRRLRKR